MDGHIGRGHGGHEGRQHQGVDGDARLQPGVGAQRAVSPVSQVPEAPRAQGQAAHEGHQHRGGGVGADPEHEGQHAHPGDLVNQAGEAGKEAEGEDGAAQN